MSDRAKCVGIVLGTTMVVSTLSYLGWKHYWYYYWFYSLNFGEHIKHCTAQKPRPSQRCSRGGNHTNKNTNTDTNNGELVHPPLPQHLRELLSACRLACVIDAKHYECYETNQSIAAGMFLTRFTYVRSDTDNDTDNDVIVMSVNPGRERNRLGALRLLESCRRAPTEVALLVHTANAQLNASASASANASASAVAKARSEERKNNNNNNNNNDNDNDKTDKTDKTDGEDTKPTTQATPANANENENENSNANANANANANRRTKNNRNLDANANATANAIAGRSPLSFAIRGSCRILTGDASDQRKYRTAHRRHHHPDPRRFRDDDDGDGDGDPCAVFLAVDVAWARLVMGGSGTNQTNGNGGGDDDGAVARARPMVGTATTPGWKKVLWGVRAVARLVSSVRVIRR